MNGKWLTALVIGAMVLVTGAVTAIAEADVLGKQGHHVAAFALGSFAALIVVVVSLGTLAKIL